uniref:Factor VIII intron 22 protein n=1 Tax=Ciona savignyi TaxID=51511 RepID=H2ZQP8_CIOSA
MSFTAGQDPDFFASYKAASNKLKKRFMKKPNIAEASEEFGQLAKSLSQQGCMHYAAFCSLATARCEQNMSNSAGEIQGLTEAGRQFLKADKSLTDIMSPNFNEHSNCAMNCFDFAVKAYIAEESPCLAAALCYEMAQYLENKGDFSIALVHYHRAAELGFQNILQSIQALKKAVSMKLLLGDYQGSLHTCTDILHQIPGQNPSEPFRLLGLYSNLHTECEILVVLLLLYLKPHASKQKSFHREILQHYVAESDPHSGMDHDLFILMQSLVIECKERNIAAIKYLQGELRPLLSVEQNELLMKIIIEFNESAAFTL